MQSAAQKAGVPSGSRCHHAVDRGDLLRLVRMGIPAGEAGALCGFSIVEDRRVPTGPATGGGSPEARRPEELPSQVPSEGAPPLWRVIGPDLRDLEPVQPPSCLAGRQPKTAEQLAGRSRSPVAGRPLASTARLGAGLRRLLAVSSPSGGVDEVGLVRRLARLRPITRLPRRLRRAWTPRLQVYWDQGEVLGPCLADQRAVLDWLRRWRGEAGLECIVVRDGGRFEWHPSLHRDRGSAEPREPRAPDGGTTLLALSDLGFARADQARQAEWAQIGRRALQVGARPAALLLCPHRRWNLPLARAWNALEWERPRAMRPGDAPLALEDLFVLLSPAVRIEPGLLREIRFLAGNGHADLGVELDTWMDPRVCWRAAALGMVLDPEAAHRLQVQFGKLPRARRDAVLAALKRFHLDLAPNILAEERLLAGEGNDTVLEPFASEALGLLTRDSHYGDLAEAEAAYLERLEWRLPAHAWKEPAVAALWAAAHRRGNGFAKPLPGDLETRDVLWALEQVPEPSWWSLSQRGTGMVLSAAPGRDAPPGPGSLLTRIRSRLPQLEVVWRDHKRRLRKAELRPGVPVELPAPAATLIGSGIEVRGDLGNARIVFDEHPAWANRFWRDADGLWVETTVRRFEWKREEAGRGRKQETLTIVPEDLTTRLLWPTWAKRLDKDQYGLVAELELDARTVSRLRWIPPGRFLMGSPDEEKRSFLESPQHWVTLSQGYWLAEAPCTQAEWKAVMKTEPSHFRGESLPEEQRNALPVEQVTWEDCQAFCEKLRARFPDLLAMLPSEAQWEYACRAGTASAFNDGSPCTQPGGTDPALAKLGWFDENSERMTQPVRGLSPNQWGLYDMHGNVWEWCQDQLGPYVRDDQVDPLRVAEGGGRVVRGGSWSDSARCCRSAYRLASEPVGRDHFLGFRLASGQSTPGQPASQERAAGKPSGRRPEAPGSERLRKKEKGKRR